MNDRTRNTPEGGGSATAVGFVVGALVGAGIALLLAPRTGKETRQRLADAGGRLGDATRGALDHARDFANDLKPAAKSATE
jgi:gas vesicle protein